MGAARHDTEYLLLGSVQKLSVRNDAYRSAELLAFAYLAQCRCDPASTMVYFTQLWAIVNSMIHLTQDAPAELQSLIVEERSRSRFTPEDYLDAVKTLGFGRDGELGVELDADVDDDFIAQAWRSARQRAWQRPADATLLRAKLNDALRLIAESRGSEKLLKVWGEEKGTGMSPDTAYSTLEVPRDMEESMLLTVYSMRVRKNFLRLVSAAERFGITGRRPAQSGGADAGGVERHCRSDEQRSTASLLGYGSRS